MEPEVKPEPKPEVKPEEKERKKPGRKKKEKPVIRLQIINEPITIQFD